MRRDPLLTGAVHLAEILLQAFAESARKVFESRTHGAKAPCSSVHSIRFAHYVYRGRDSNPHGIAARGF